MLEQEDRRRTTCWLGKSLVFGEFLLSFAISQTESRVLQTPHTIVQPPIMHFFHQLLISTSVFQTPIHAYRHNIHHNQGRSQFIQSVSIPIDPSLSLPLLMLRIQRANDIHMAEALLASFPSYALTTLTQFLNRTPNFHPSNLLSNLLLHFHTTRFHQSICP